MFDLFVFDSCQTVIYFLNRFQQRKTDYVTLKPCKFTGFADGLFLTATTVILLFF